MSCCSVNSFDFALEKNSRVKSNELTEQQDKFYYRIMHTISGLLGLLWLNTVELHILLDNTIGT